LSGDWQASIRQCLPQVGLSLPAVGGLTVSVAERGDVDRDLVDLAGELKAKGGLYAWIWRSMSPLSKISQASASLPPAIRNVLTAGTRSWFPLGATPANSPVCLNSAAKWQSTRSPSARRKSISILGSLKKYG
jgi:hypothetical protein